VDTAAEGAEAAAVDFEAAEGAAEAAPLEAAEAAPLEAAEAVALVGEGAEVAAAQSGAGAAAAACRGEVAPSARLARPAITLTDAGRQARFDPACNSIRSASQRMHASRARRGGLSPSLSKMPAQKRQRVS
jgi:hypothetical protein